MDKRGRPAVEQRARYMSVSVREELHKKIRVLAERTGLTIAAQVQALLCEGVEKYLTDDTDDEGVPEDA